MEAIETVIELAASNIDYQKHVLRLSDVNETSQLLEVALRKIPFLFHAIAADKWRIQVLKKEITPKNYNKIWWKLRLVYLDTVYMYIFQSNFIFIS